MVLELLAANTACVPVDLLILNVAMASFNGLLAFVAFSQLIRIHMRSQRDGRTRQKVSYPVVVCIYIIQCLAYVQVYEYFIGVAVLLTGGALGFYGFLLFYRLKKVRSEEVSSEMKKVSGLAVVCVVCFTTSALVDLLTDIPLSYNWRFKRTNGIKSLVLLILYFCMGVQSKSHIMKDSKDTPLIKGAAAAAAGCVTIMSRDAKSNIGV